MRPSTALHTEAPQRCTGAGLPGRPLRRAGRSITPQTAFTRPRSFATSIGARHADSPMGGCCGNGPWSPATRRSRSRPGCTIRPGPTTGACRVPPSAAARATSSASGSSTARSIHTRSTSTDSIHPAMDGVPGVGAGLIQSGGETTYEFNAEPFGLHLYHCHAGPLAEHIARGLYGAFIVDPKKGRSDADELVMVMNGFNTNFDAEGNQLYGVNTVAFHYVNEPIEVRPWRAGADLPGQRARVRPDQLVPHPRELLQLLPDRDLAPARPSTPTPSSRARPRGGSSSSSSPTSATTCSMPTRRSSPSLVGWASSGSGARRTASVSRPPSTTRSIQGTRAPDGSRDRSNHRPEADCPPGHWSPVRLC